MHPQIQQRVDGLNAMRARTQLATAEFYAMIGKERPAQAIRYQVVAKGTSAYHVMEIATGKVVGFRFSWKEAVNFAQVLESRADGVVVILSSAVLQ
jgi:fibrillarin-like rRNA methylase